MSNDDLFERVQSLLQRKLTPEELQFLVLATEVLVADKKKPAQRPADSHSRIA